MTFLNAELRLQYEKHTPDLQSLKTERFFLLISNQIISLPI